jgi:hypothetical protein
MEIIRHRIHQEPANRYFWQVLIYQTQIRDDNCDDGAQARKGHNLTKLIYRIQLVDRVFTDELHKHQQVANIELPTSFLATGCGGSVFVRPTIRTCTSNH